MLKQGETRMFETSIASKQLIQRIADYYQRLTNTICNLNLASIENAANLIKQAWLGGHQIICFGNGGSALTAQHFMTDWNKCIFLQTGKQFHGRCLTENMGLVTAYSNDVSYQDIFLEQLKTLMRPNDLVIGISGSGNSENVLRAIEYANQQNNMTLGLCGYDGGKLKSLAKHPVWIPVNDMQLSEDLHFIFGHVIMRSLCEEHIANKS